MGVVRSGLNQPLNALLDKKYITVEWLTSSVAALVAVKSTTSPKRAEHGFTSIPMPLWKAARHFPLRSVWSCHHRTNTGA